MNKNERAKRISKRLSLVLRHRPEAAGIRLDEAGWVEVEALLRAFGKKGWGLRREELEEVVRTNDKRRFAFSEDGARIRASQGHSVRVELGYTPAEPPTVLLHGTVAAALPSIRSQGLLRGQRHHVHLSEEVQVARQVGGRRGRPVILEVAARQMAEEGHLFYRSDNGVWLTEAVPPRFLTFPPG